MREGSISQSVYPEMPRRAAQMEASSGCDGLVGLVWVIRVGGDARVAKPRRQRMIIAWRLEAVLEVVACILG